MKLVIIITHQKNTEQLEEEFIKQKIQFTKMETMGGFLRKKNMTYYVGVEDKQVEEIVELTKKNCRGQEEIAETPWFVTGQPEEMVIPESQTKVKVGGATIFVLDVNEMIKIWVTRKKYLGSLSNLKHNSMHHRPTHFFINPLNN